MTEIKQGEPIYTEAGPPPPPPPTPAEAIARLREVEEILKSPDGIWVRLAVALQQVRENSPIERVRQIRMVLHTSLKDAKDIKNGVVLKYDPIPPLADAEEKVERAEESARAVHQRVQGLIMENTDLRAEVKILKGRVDDLEKEGSTKAKKEVEALLREVYQVLDDIQTSFDNARSGVDAYDEQYRFLNPVDRLIRVHRTHFQEQVYDLDRPKKTEKLEPETDTGTVRPYGGLLDPDDDYEQTSSSSFFHQREVSEMDLGELPTPPKLHKSDAEQEFSASPIKPEKKDESVTS